MVQRLFELEVPEISNGVVEIKACARDAGHRSKMAVYSNDPNVDPIGACVGARGARVRMVTDELRGEKIDIIPFAADPAEYVERALQPAKVRQVVLDEATMTATVTVDQNQLSLAIGKEGQNVKLANRLTGWNINIQTEDGE
jgi:N utilization substance protein A